MGIWRKKPEMAEKPKRKGNFDKCGRRSKFHGQFIYKLQAENPRREYTHGHKSWSIIIDGMSYEAYIDCGGRREDLVWEISKGRIEMRAQ